MAGIVVLDAGALIALYSKNDEHNAWAMQMFLDTVEFEYEMSVLTLAEVLIHPTRAGKQDQFLKGISGLRIATKELEADAAMELANLRSRTKLKMPDVVVLYQAIKSGALIATTDRTLARMAKKYNVSCFCP